MCSSGEKGAKVMFTAMADLGGNYGPFEQDSTMVFNTEIINIGGHYDCTIGVFTASVPGYYYFTFFYHAGKKHKSGLILVKNDKVIVRAFNDNLKGPEFSVSVGNAAFLQLEQGDKVSVRLPAECQVYTSKCVTTFSGFLVSQIENGV